MPGITGIISNSENAQHDLDQMLKCMLHEPFYSYGKYSNRYLGLYVAWTCHKESFADCLPIYNEKRDVMLLFSGEHFADNDEAFAIKSRGHEFTSFSDASRLVHLYEDKGDSFLDSLNGFFNGMIVDLRLNKIVLFNDRYGMQRMYYHDRDGDLLFSSEAKSILAIRPELRDICSASLAELLSCGCVLDNKTLFSHIHLLPGASAWTIDKSHTIKKTYYFKPVDWENQDILNDNTFSHRLRETFINILPRYFSPEGKVGLSLTGGIDTRMMLACFNASPKSLPCFTFAGPFRDSFDVKISRKVAAACRQNHVTLRLDRKFISDFSDLAEKAVFITDGCIEISGVPNLYVNQLARNVALIRLTGNYGQEVLRRYVAFRPSNIHKRVLSTDLLPHFREAINTYNINSTCHPLTFALFKQAPWYQYPRLNLEQSMLTQRSPFMDNDLAKLVYQAPRAVLQNANLSKLLITDLNANLAAIPTDRGVMGNNNPLFAAVLRAHHEFFFKMEYYYNHGMPQWMASIDNSLRWLDLEKLFLGRHKYYHLRYWFRGELREYVKDVLLSQRCLSRFYLQKAAVENLVNRHIKGDRNYTDTISHLLAIELMYRLMIDRP